jgi:hypothetical protein
MAVVSSLDMTDASANFPRATSSFNSSPSNHARPAVAVAIVTVVMVSKRSRIVDNLADALGVRTQRGQWFIPG